MFLSEGNIVSVLEILKYHKVIIINYNIKPFINTKCRKIVPFSLNFAMVIEKINKNSYDNNNMRTFTNRQSEIQNINTSEVHFLQFLSFIIFKTYFMTFSFF